MKLNSCLPTCVVVGLFTVLSGCATSPPPSRAQNNICDIIQHEPAWYFAAKASEEKWGTSVAIQKAFVQRESSFVHNARPPRPYFLGFIPMPRKSSAYGYAQAQDAAWSDYKQATGKRMAQRTSMADALDFIGWYNHMSRQRNGVSLNDSYNLYLNYHEGHTGFRNRTYEQKAWLMSVARQVESQSRRYEQQLPSCKIPSRLCVWPFC